MSRSFWHVTLIVAVGLIALLPHLGSTRLWDRDEPRNAGCAREMLQRDDWIVPTFNGELRVLKPIIGYWCTMLAYQVFGVSEFAARFASALFAIGGAVLTYFLGRRLFNERVGLWSGLILSTSLLWGVTGQLAIVDAHLMFFTALALCVFVYGVFRPVESLGETEGLPIRAALTSDFPKWPVAALLYVVIGLAVLTKGFVGLIPPLAVIGLFMLIVSLPPAPDGSGSGSLASRLLRPFAPLHVLRTCLRMRPLTAILVVLAVAAPWYVWVGLRTDGEFLRGFFLEHHFGRALRPMEGHGGPFLLYYLGTILIGFFPWSVFMIAALITLVRQIRAGHAWSAGYLFSACWIGAFVFIFSVPRTKLPGYIVPCYPALALITGCFIHRWTSGMEAARFWPRLSMLTLGGTGAAILAATAIVAHLLLPGEEWLGLLGLVPLLAAGAALIFLKQDRLRHASVALLVGAFLFNTAFFSFGLARVSRHQEQNRLFAEMLRNSPEPRIGWYGCLEPSWVFYLERPIQPLTLDNADDDSDPASPWKMEPLHAAEFLRQGSDCYILTDERHWQWLQPRLPANAVVLADCPYFLRRNRLLLIGQAPTPPTRLAVRTPGK